MAKTQLLGLSRNFGEEGILLEHRGESRGALRARLGSDNSPDGRAR